MDEYKSEIEEFIYRICYKPMHSEVNKYINQHIAALKLCGSAVKHPDSAKLENMSIELVQEIKVDGDILSFEAAVCCLISIFEHDEYGRTGYDNTLQWFIVSCRAEITDELKSLEIESVSNYKSKQAKPKQEVSRNIVPIIHKCDLEKVAEDFLSEYCPQALEAPMRVPIREIAEGIGLKIVEGKRITSDFSVFGEICFSAGEIKVFDPFDLKSHSLQVERGTIIIDADTYWERNKGCVNNTIAHEVFHWRKHRMYAAIKQILHGEKVITCRCPTDKIYTYDNLVWTDEQRMEWQANSIAPRILMPARTFNMKVAELREKYSCIGDISFPTVLDFIVNDLAFFYEVSKQSAMIRMIETGHKEAEELEKAAYHNYVDRNDAFHAYRTNEKLRELLDKELFLYVDGYFVINDEQFVKRLENGKFTLTEKARENLDGCTLQFTLRKIIPPDISPGEFMHRDNTQAVSELDEEKSSETIKLSAELQAKQEEFEKQKHIHSLMTPGKTGWELLGAIIKDRGMTSPHFCQITNLGTEAYEKCTGRRKVKSKQDKRTIMAIACGLDLDFETTNFIMQASGHAFSTASPEDEALKFCITGYRGHAIEARNEFLTNNGYKTLGAHSPKDKDPQIE